MSVEEFRDEIRDSMRPSCDPVLVVDIDAEEVLVKAPEFRDEPLVDLRDELRGLAGLDRIERAAVALVEDEVRASISERQLSVKADTARTGEVIAVSPEFPTARGSLGVEPTPDLRLLVVVTGMSVPEVRAVEERVRAVVGIQAVGSWLDAIQRV